MMNINVLYPPLKKKKKPIKKHGLRVSQWPLKRYCSVARWPPPTMSHGIVFNERRVQLSNRRVKGDSFLALLLKIS